MVFTLTEKRKEIELNVQDTDPSYVGRNIVTLDRTAKSELDVTSGDIVELEGTKNTAAVIWPARQEDEGRKIIRMDSLIRHNAGASLGEKVRVRKADFKEAKKVILAPTQEVRIIASGYDRILKKSFIGRPINRGDNVWISVFGSGFIYRVLDTNPRGIVKITDFTQFVLKEEPVKEDAEGIPRVAYEDIGGLEEQVTKIREMIELPMRHPELFQKLGISPPKGVLLFGPPGTGKTLLAKAVASETNAHFISINAPAVMSKYVGEAEERIRQMFKEAEDNAPSIIFIDEIDAIAPKREEVIGEVERRVVAQLLAAMDGMEARGNTIVIAATNRVNSLDEALRRPGRFDREVEIGVPDKKGRKEILQIHTRGMPLAKDVDLDHFSSITHGFVGADLAALVKESAMKALRRYLPKMNLEEETIPPEVLEALEVNKKDFLEALKEAQPSALREVMVEIPNVKWNDIGALEEVKEELKQAVEWPLKNPSAFKKMGIRPPRGILLYGPPGTGKTMLAKAVATESEANFISIKGPELVSMWVGESLPYNEELFVKKENEFLKMPIGKIVEEKKKVEVVSFDEKAKSIVSKIADYIKHPIRTNLLEITTKTGRKIRVTDDHSLFTLINGEVNHVPLKYLKEGESYIVIPKKLPEVNSSPKEIDLIEIFKNEKNILVKDAGSLLKPFIKKIGYKSLAEILKIKNKYAYDITDKNVSIPLPKFLLLVKKFNLKIDLKSLRLGVRGSRNALPSIIPLSKNLTKFIGLWVAEGDYNNEFVRIHNKNPEIVAELDRICKNLKLNYTKTKTCFIINSMIFKKLMEKGVGLKKGAKNKRAPKLLFTLPNKLIADFLRGYYSGDGSIYGNSHRYVIEASTESKGLADDLLYLLLRFGIVASCYEKREWNNNKTYRILFMGVKNFREFSRIGFIDKKRNQKIKAYIKAKKWERSDQIPITGKLLSFIEENLNYWTNNLTIGKDRLKKLLNEVDPKRIKYSKFWELVEGDMYFDLVKKIKRIPYSAPVYDLSINPRQNFLGGFGGIFVHNTERGIRKVFRRARQVSPVIIFFDEIDSLASTRGSGFDSGVGERTVNQLLTELDGIEDLKDVVFIAATNRPDLVDPGLLRPGRIDKLVKVSAPDTRARKEIFKIHLKGVPIAKDVNTEELVKKTEGFSGADIEGLVRESALISLKENKLQAKEVTMNHFFQALNKIHASISKETEEAYDGFKDKHSVFKPSYVG